MTKNLKVRPSCCGSPYFIGYFTNLFMSHILLKPRYRGAAGSISLVGYGPPKAWITTVPQRGLMETNDECESCLEFFREKFSLLIFSPGGHIWSPRILPPRGWGGLRGNRGRWGWNERSFVYSQDKVLKFGKTEQNCVDHRVQNVFPPAVQLVGISQHWLI